MLHSGSKQRSHARTHARTHTHSILHCSVCDLEQTIQGGVKKCPGEVKCALFLALAGVVKYLVLLLTAQ